MLFFVNNTNAQTVRVRLPDTTALRVGNIVEIPVYVDSLLTGKNVTSYQFSILFSGSLSSFTFLDVNTTGTISSSFGTPIYSFGNYIPSPSYKILQVAAAGTSPLVGKGKLFNIRIRITNSGAIYPQFLSNTSCIFNQGSPALNLVNGTWSITPNPNINISLNGISPLTIGDSVNVYVNGGQAPYQLNFINGNIGTFSPNTQQGSSYYFIKGTNAGKSKIRIVDANNYVDTTDLDLEVVANKLRINDTTVLPQNFITIPLKINSVTGRGVLSGSLALTYNSNLRVDSVLLGGTILQNSAVQWNNINNLNGTNTLYLSFANSNALTGSGDFVKVRFRVLNPFQTYLNFTNVVFNQNTNVAIKNANISFTNVPQLSIFPNGMQLVAGDSVKLNITGGRKPYQLALNNTNIASLDTGMYLKAKSSGNAIVTITDSLGAVLNSNAFQLFDANLSLANISALPNTWVEVPVFISKLPLGKSISSFQMQFNINQLSVDSLIVINANTLSQNFSLLTNYSNNILNVVAASANAITQPGMLFKLRFKLKSSVTVGNTVYLNLNSQLINEGDVKLKDNLYSAVTVVNQLQKDIQVESILNLSSSCTKSSNESLTVRLYNSGNFNYFIGDKIKVAYRLNNLNVVYDTLTLNSNFNSGNRVDFTFKNKLNLTIPRQYIIKSYTELAGDINTANDTSILNFQVFGTPNLKLQNDTSVCSGNSITLSSNLSGGTFLWNNGSTSNSINVSTTGTYSLIFTSSNNCVAYDTVRVTVLPSQTTPTITASGGLNFCEGDSVILNTNANNTIQWLRNGVVIPNANSQSIVVKTSGLYTIRSSAIGFCDAISTATTVNVFAKPAKPIISNNTNDSLCVGSSSILQSTFTGTAKWYRNGIEILNATGSTFTATQSGAYTIKVTNASNCSAESDTFKLVFINNPDTANITASSTQICFGDSIVLVSNKSNNIQWYLNNNLIANATNDTLIVKQTGSYKVVIKNLFGCSTTSNIVNVTVNQIPTKPIVNLLSNDTLCLGTQAQLQTNSIGNLQWYRNGVIISNATSSTLNTNLSGWYKVKITNNSQCEAISDSVRIIFLNNPDTAKISANITEACIGDTLTITSDISNNIVWYLNNNIIQNSENSPSIKVTNSGVYKVVSTNAFGCSSNSNSININFNQNPTTPQITQTGNTLTSTSANSYQWYLNDTIIVSATQQSLNITQSGNYKVEVKNQFNCDAISDNFNAVFVGLDEEEVYFHVYPNPTENRVEIKSNIINDNISVKIYDVLGRLMDVQYLNNEIKFVDLSNLQNGNYILIINNRRFSIIKI